MMNPYRQLIELLPSDPLMIGEVAAHNPDGTSTVLLPGGAAVRARGQPVSVGVNAFFRGEVIEGEAPTLPVELIDV